MESTGGSRAVVFDCDGVLVDSERLAWQAWSTVLAQHCIDVGAVDIRNLTGRTQRDVYRAFARRGSLPSEEETLAAVARRTAEAFEHDLRPFSDAVATVEALAKRGALLAVASSSPRWRLDVSLRAVGLARYFAVTMAGDEVTRGKPAPDLYLAAAHRLGIDPFDCVAVEDTGTGVAAAAAAGMRVIAVVRADGNRDALEAADRVVDRLDPDLFECPR